MSRLTRINELLMRELSDLLHTRYRDGAVSITVTEVDITPDLRTAHVYYAVLGDAQARQVAKELLESLKPDLRTRVFKRVTLKYTPSLEFHYDDSLIRGNRTLAILDDLAAKGEFQNPSPEHAPPPPVDGPDA